jgi:hypothetical protein
MVKRKWIQNKLVTPVNKKVVFKLKRISNALIDEIPDITIYKNDAYLFGKKDFGQYWEANETSRRNDYSDYL